MARLTDILFNYDSDETIDTLNGLARQCPKCKIVAHYEIKTRAEVEVNCKLCDFTFKVKKYRRNERPKPTKRRG